MTWQELYQQGVQILTRQGVKEASLDARLLLEEACNINHSQFMMDGRIQNATREQEHRYQELIQMRGERVPLQHILGTTEFMGLTFRVNGDVLVPRQDTECLVEQALPYVKDKKVLDLCTGSGCIAISLAKLGMAASVTASDLSEAALAIAKENARMNEQDVIFVHSDMFQEITGKFDIIISNPPYIETKEIERLEPELRDYEPMMALDGREDGLHFYREIIKSSIHYIEKNGQIFFEIGYNQGEAVMDELRRTGYVDVQCFKDYAGLDRVVTGRYGFEIR